MESVLKSPYIDLGIYPGSYSRDCIQEQIYEMQAQEGRTKVYSLEEYKIILQKLCDKAGADQSNCQRVIERLMPIVKRCLAQVAEQVNAPPRESLDQFEGQALFGLFRVGRGLIVEDRVQILFSERIEYERDRNSYWELKLETPFENGEVIVQTLGRILQLDKSESAKKRIAQLEGERAIAKEMRCAEDIRLFVTEKAMPVLTKQMLSVEAMEEYTMSILITVGSDRAGFEHSPTFSFKYVEPDQGTPYTVCSIKYPLCDEKERVLPDITPNMRKQVLFGSSHKNGGKLSNDDWLGLETPVQLRDLLEERGHLTVKGEFGPTYYEAQPKQATLHGQKVNYWPKGSVRKDGEHCEVKIVGCDWKERVFYRVKDDENVYVMSWKRFKEIGQSQ